MGSKDPEMRHAFIPFSPLPIFRARLMLRKESGEIEREMVRLESGGNDGKVNSVGSGKV